MRHTRVYLLVKFRHHFNHNSLSQCGRRFRSSTSFGVLSIRKAKLQRASEYFKILQKASDGFRKHQKTPELLFGRPSLIQICSRFGTGDLHSPAQCWFCSRQMHRVPGLTDCCYTMYVCVHITRHGLITHITLQCKLCPSTNTQSESLVEPFSSTFS